MPSPRFRVQCCTYNGHLTGHKSEDDITAWLIPTLEEDSDDYSSQDPPDIVAIGFQEMIPLHLSLLGLTKTALDLTDHKLKEAIENHANVKNAHSAKRRGGSSSNGAANKERYTLMAKHVLGGIALLVYTRDATMTSKVIDVRVATAACGIFRLMGNKGAVGVRIVMDHDEPDPKAESRSGAQTGNIVYTFVTTHLAAHDKGLKRRNEDYESIVSRLVFTQGDGASPYWRPNNLKPFHRLAYTEQGTQIYDTSYLFVFGDLNYRISKTTPKPLAPHLISHKLANDMDFLLEQDQLKQEQAAGRTLHHLQEGKITFRPTYKYKPGTVSEMKKFTKRIPGWCDRVLFATWADGEEGAGVLKRHDGGPERRRKGPRVELYRSVMQFVRSDHKPVTAIIALPRHPKHAHALRLPFKAPYRIDPGWRTKKTVGWVIDRFVGFWWTIVLLAGLNRDLRLGFANLAGAALAAWWYRALLYSGV